jgi:hypothetical protein
MVYGVLITEDCLTNIVFPDDFLRHIDIAKEIIRECAKTLIRYLVFLHTYHTRMHHRTRLKTQEDAEYYVVINQQYSVIH